MRPGALSLFAPPYRCLESITDPKTFSGRLRSNPGAAVLWGLEEGDWESTFRLRQARHRERERELAEWLVLETHRLGLTQRNDEAGMLLTSLD